jgi:hypothetical protein
VIAQRLRGARDVPAIFAENALPSTKENSFVRVVFNETLHRLERKANSEAGSPGPLP